VPSHRKPRRISGVCLAGSLTYPRIWYRNLGDGTYQEFHGRQNMNPGAVAAGEPKREFICNVRQIDPIETCRPCAAYRNRADGIRMIAEAPTSLTSDEYALLADGDTEAFYARIDSGRTVATLARWYPSAADVDDAVAEYRNETSRRWRAAHPGADKRKRNRAEYMRDYRKRNPSGPTPSRGTGKRQNKSEVRTRARAREGCGPDGLQKGGHE
jgi:hypothetical protein